MITVESLSKSVNGIAILKDINFTIPSGSVLGIIGESGSGKTSLLMCLSALQEFSAGKITVNNMNLTGGQITAKDPYIWDFRKHMGIVFQHLYLFPHLTVLGNITEAPVHVLGTPLAEAESAAQKLLGSVGLSNKADNYPDELSGGEQQRVAICRALAMQPDVLLLDEPTSALDPRYSSDIRTVLNDYVAGGKTLIIVSHSLNFLRGFAGYFMYMEKGRLIEFNTAEEFLNNTADSRTKKFLEHFNQTA